MIVFDIETDGLNPSKIHCLSYTSDGVEYKTLTEYADMKQLLENEKGLIGHNIMRYDIPVLERILDIKIKSRLYDTLPMSWVMNYDRGKHGLDSFGDEFGIPKPVVTDWSEQPVEVYIHRCVEDVKINWKLWKNLLKRFMFVYKDKKNLDKFFGYLSFKMNCANAAERVGWKIDLQLAEDSITTLKGQQAEKVKELREVMPMRKVMSVKTKPKVCLKKDGSVSTHGKRWFDLLASSGLPSNYEGDVTVVKGVEDSNPNSPDQVKDWLFGLGWEPCTYKFDKNKETGEEKKIPQVRKNGELTKSVEILIKNNPAVGVLDGLTVIQHRLGIFHGFVECEENGYVKAGVKGLTNTLRFKHVKPLVNLPGVDKPWGKEIRGCLTAPEGYTLCGADMTSLEDTTKRHYMKPYDPDYVEEMSKKGFDPHLDLAKHAGSVTQEQIDKHNSGEVSLKSLRKNYKVVNYSATYGVGAAKLSRETGMSVGEASALLDAYWERNWAVKQFAEDQKIKKINGEMWVQNPVSKFWHNLRYEKDAFSTINQSTGAYCFDKWVALYRTKRGNIIGQFHDESINLVKNGDEEVHTTALLWAIEKLNKELKLNVDLGIDVQYGQRYSEIH